MSLKVCPVHACRRLPVLNALEHDPGAHDVFKPGTGLFKSGLDDLETSLCLSDYVTRGCCFAVCADRRRSAYGNKLTDPYCP